MLRMGILLFISMTGFSASAQLITFSGKVISNKSNNPISGAIIALQGQELSDTTAADGSYSLTVNVAVNPTPIHPSTEGISFKNGIVSISIAKPAPLRIDIFNMRGDLLDRMDKRFAPAGEYRFDLMAHLFSANMMVIRAASGRRVSSFRYLPLHNGKRLVASSVIASVTELAAIDSLKISAPGYLRKRMGVFSYNEKLNIILDTLPLNRFSFFVTSLEALQELSGSDNGFGGDLRFGKTGPGAGLLGADSICQCIAEKSMPGSKIKIWRAFLSVASGPDGKQVDAIDRIGDGPWYDRRGRLVASDLPALLHNRPIGIDTLIKDDFPNENGTPNHQPDPGQPQIDNHLTITGSNKFGKLYSPTSTCEDWTSTTADSKPRCGLSWTRLMEGGWWGGGDDNTVGKRRESLTFDTTGQGFFFTINMKSWISAWSLSGCEAGVDLNDSTGPGVDGVKTIGNGGGYGGFYCFAHNP